MAKRSKLELYEQIRKAHDRDGLSIRSLATTFGVHRRTVREALASPIPPPRRVPERSAPVLGPWTEIIDSWLADDLNAPKKQRHTARRVFERLVDEHGAELSETTVRRYVAVVKSHRRMPLTAVMVPQDHPLGYEAEVDFGQASFYLNGELTVGSMFVMRLSASAKGFHHVYANEAQEAFVDGHELGFEHFGGVPERIRYDNLKPAVARVMLGRSRVESERFVALRSHYLFDAFYCRPGIDGAHEKGGVEGEVGRFRRRHLVPVPKVSSLAELNELLARADELDDARHLPGRRLSVGAHFDLERPMLRALPEERFDAALWLQCRVDSKSRICVRQCFYSVPVSYVGRKIDVRLGASFVEALDGKKVLARHERAVRKGTETLDLDHYLEVMKVKPGALLGSTALAQARSSGSITPAHSHFLELARRRLGDKAATSAFVEVLLLHRTCSPQAISTGIEAALGIGSLDPNVVALEARRSAERLSPVETEVGDLVRFDRPPPTLDPYDDLLRKA
jgi:transposase